MKAELNIDVRDRSHYWPGITLTLEAYDWNALNREIEDAIQQIKDNEGYTLLTPMTHYCPTCKRFVREMEVNNNLYDENGVHHEGGVDMHRECNRRTQSRTRKQGDGEPLLAHVDFIEFIPIQNIEKITIHLSEEES